MNVGQSLDLRDIHLPAEPGFWPPAPGWWIVAAIALALLGWAGLRLRARMRRRARQRRDVARVDALLAAHPPQDAAVALVAALSELLRRMAKRDAPHALTLRDDAWLRFLDRDDADAPFTRGVGRLLLDGPYRPRVDPADAQALHALVRARVARWETP